MVELGQSISDYANLPLRYEDNEIRVYDNGSGEIFVENLKSGVKIRVTPDFRDLRVTASGCQITPGSVRGLPAFYISER